MPLPRMCNLCAPAQGPPYRLTFARSCEIHLSISAGRRRKVASRSYSILYYIIHYTMLY